MNQSLDTSHTLHLARLIGDLMFFGVQKCISLLVILQKFKVYLSLLISYGIFCRFVPSHSVSSSFLGLHGFDMFRSLQAIATMQLLIIFVKNDTKAFARIKWRKISLGKFVTVEKCILGNGLVAVYYSTSLWKMNFSKFAKTNTYRLCKKLLLQEWWQFFVHYSTCQSQKTGLLYWIHMSFYKCAQDVRRSTKKMRLEKHTKRMLPTTPTRLSKHSLAHLTTLKALKYGQQSFSQYKTSGQFLTEIWRIIIRQQKIIIKARGCLC